MIIAVGADHGGVDLKKALLKHISLAGHRVLDMGTRSKQPCDYPMIGAKVAKAISKGRVPRGLLLCKSGNGMAIVANKFHGVRATVCQTIALARHAREHNDSNVLVLGAEHTTGPRAKKIFDAWLSTPFAGGRHARRVGQIARIEKEIHFEPP